MTNPQDDSSSAPDTGAAETSAPSIGQTGGLPGANAAPGAGQISEDEMADTVSAAGPAEGTAAHEGGTGAGSNG